MRFINSIELFGLANTEISSIDSTTIKKAKRVLLAEIDLSDRHQLDYHGSAITKTDVEVVSAELLESSEKIEFYHFIAKYKELNNFLIEGDLKLFENYRQESIYKLQSFIEFISPFYLLPFEKALLKSYQSKIFSSFKKLISVVPPLSPTDLQKCYRTLTLQLKEQLQEVTTLSDQIKNKTSIYDESDIEEVVGWLEDKIEVKYYNILPSDFQNTRNSAAQTIRNLSVDVFNTYNEVQLAIDILEYALSFSIDGLVSDNLNTDLKHLFKINEDRKEQLKVEPILEKYGTLLAAIRKYKEDIDKKLIYSTVVESWVNVNISVSELNTLESTFDQIRNHIALSLRSLSVAIWNSYTDIDVATRIINKAMAITVSDAETKKILKEARDQLSKFKSEMAIVAPTRSTYTPSAKPIYAPTKQIRSSSSDNSGAWGCGIVIVIIMLIGLVKSCNDSSSSSYTPSSSSTSTPITTETSTPATTETNSPTTSSTPSSTSSNSYSYTPPTPVISPYKGNQLKNGASPFNTCFGAGVFNGECNFTVHNYSGLDAIVCLYDTHADQTIRNKYVRHGTSLTITNISEGYYTIRVLYGNDWNPTITSPCGSSGFFDTDVDFKETDDVKHIESGYSYTYTLHSALSGNTTSSKVDRSKFFRK